MKIVAISDTHNQHQKLTLPDGDMLIHAGDYSNIGTLQDTINFLTWFAAQPHRIKIFIAGNHDFYAEREPEQFRTLLPDSIIYLENESVTVEGIKIWGSPVTPYYGGLAFNKKRGADSKAVWEQIPTDTNIVITHGPPAGILDRTYMYMNVGCQDLMNKLEAVTPRYHIFGHIHEQYGMVARNETTFINATQVNLLYRLVKKPIIFDY
jgi:Icc-related predicted phosphoesterase